LKNLQKGFNPNLKFKKMTEQQKKEFKITLAESRAARTEALNFLMLDGESIDLTDWLTIKNYTTRFGLADTHIVTNWIRRGIVPAENVKTIPELNGIRLIKAVPYKDLI
jgi:hypothetical protein